MMRLLVDIGNSRLKYAVLENGHFREAGTLDTDQQLATNLERAWCELPVPDGVLVASVAGSAVLNEIAAVADGLRWPCPHPVEVQRRTSRLIVGYDDVRGLGVDRWLAMLGARRRTTQPFVVVDAGTAITLDAVDNGGRHRGGGIVPGLSAMRGALPEAIRPVATRLKAQVPVFPATNTADGIESGVLLGLADMVSGLIDRLAADLATNPSVFLTGGDVVRLAPYMRQASEQAPDLVLEGLTAVADEVAGP